MNLKSLKIYLLAVGLVVAGVLSACYVGANSTFYGFNAEKEFLYTQNKEWWTVGDGSNKNGSALAAFATVASHLNKTKITPAAVAKLAYEKGYWNLSGGIPTNLVDNLLKEYSNVKSVSSSGSNISQKISLVAQAFTKMENAAVVVRANGASPFNTSEAGGHYLAILAYRSDGQVHVYDPATEELSWYSAKSLFRKMTKNSMLYAISFSASGDDLSVFTPSRAPQPVSEEEITIEVEDPAQPETEDDPESQDESPLILDFSIDEPTEPITEEKFDGSSVTILGDSMIARSNSDREYSEATSMSWYVKYYNGKVLSSLAGLKNALIDGTDGLTFSEGIAKIKNLKAANVRDNFVVDLGSNNCTSSVKGRCGEPAVTDTQVSELISAVRSKNKNARIFFVTNYVATESPKSKTDYSKLKEINRSVFEKAVSENEKVYLVDWAAAVKSQSSPSYYVHAEGHPTVAGSKALGNLIIETVQSHLAEESDTTNCDVNPSAANCTADDDPSSDDGDTGIEPEGDQYFDDFSAEQLTGTSRAVFDDALSSAWPTIVETGSETASGTCYDSYGNPYTNYAADSQKCKASIKSELRTLLEATGLSSNLATAQSSSSFIGALLIKNNAISSLNKNNLTQSYLYELLNAGTNGWGRVDSPVSGDIVYYNSKFFYWIGDSGRNWGNAITAGDGWVPHIENVTLSGTYRVYRYGGGGTGGGDGGDYTLPPEYWDVAPGDQVAIRAMSYSWPYTRYSTDEESLWGSCVKKYETAVAKSSGEEALAMSLSKFPSTTAASLASKNLSKYPTGTKCNTTITPDYAKFKNITSTSKMNNYPVGSMSFVRNVFISLGVNINYLSISDLRKNAEQLTNFDLITKKADKNTELQPGDLLVAKDAAMIYVGDYGEAYGKVAQSYKGKWTPRLTPIYYNSTYVFRLKSSASVSEEGDCPELSMDSVEGNEKIAVAAANVAWPYRTGKGSEIGKCLNGSQLTTYPPAYTYKVSNTKLTTTNKKLSTLLKEIKATGCLGTARSSLSSLLSDAGLSNPKSDINYVYAALKAAGIKRFEVNTDLNNLSAATAFNNLKSDSENFTLVTKKLTSKNKSSLQRGDIIIASQTKNKKTYSKIMIYIGKYGKDCLGVNYGSVVDANSSAVPYVRPLSYYLNDSSSYMNYYVFRAKTSAYEEPVQQPEPEQPEQPEEPEEPEQPEEPTNPCPSNPNSSECAAYCQTNPDADGCGGLPHACDLLADSTECASYCSANPNAKECLGRKIAIKAVEFSWPYTKYSLQDDSGALKSLYGKCVGWGNKVISSYPNLNGKIRVKDENYAAINCGRVYTPLMLKYLAGASWSVTDIIAFDGAYNATMAKKGTKIYNLLTKKDSYRDCIGFANRVLKAAGASTGNLKAWAGGTIKGWTKIGYGVKMPSKENQKMPQKPNVLYIEETMPGYKNATLQPGDVVIRLGGRHCATLGKEESSYSGKKVCASHIMFYVGSFGGVYGNRVDSNGWLGAQSSGSNINTGAGYIHSLYMDDHIYGAGDGTIIYRYTGE